MSSNNDLEKNDEKVALIQQQKKEVNEEKVPQQSGYWYELFVATVYETIAMFMFVIIIYYCHAEVGKFVFGFWIILTLFGSLSGAHVNPAITLGFYIYEQKFLDGLPKLLLYTAGQFIGALLGALVSRPFANKDVYVVNDFHYGAVSVFWAEFFFTGTFLFVILFVCSAKINLKEGSCLKCAIIVSWFYAIVNAGSTLSGAAYNPAILTILNGLAHYDNNKGAINYLPVMIPAELLGVTAFSLIFKYCFEERLSRKKEEELPHHQSV